MPISNIKIKGTVSLLLKPCPGREKRSVKQIFVEETVNNELPPPHIPFTLETTTPVFVEVWFDVSRHANTSHTGL